jgi:SOS response regulatory protein OraA/RecX
MATNRPPRVTALYEEAGGRVRVELDDRPWRTLPVDVVARAGLARGCELDRPRALLVRRELRRSEALTRAARALRRRDLPERALETRLRRAGFREDEREAALGTLTRAGLVDDTRFAHMRAASLAERGRGDAAIRWDLEHQGVAPEVVGSALEALAPERDRALALAARHGANAATARMLARRGFGEEAVEAACADQFGADA